MSYSIQYGPAIPPKSRKKKGIRVSLLICAVLLPTLILSAVAHPAEATAIKESVFPWEQAYVQEAFSDFSDSVRSGENFKDAVAALYSQILHGQDQVQ